MARSDRTQPAGTALGGVMAAGSFVLLWLACVAPSGRAGLTAAAGLFPMLAALYAGWAAGCLCWLAASLLGLLLLPDKGVAVMFLAFLGLYPIVKGRLEALGRLWLEWCLKLVFFNGELTLFWFFLRAFFMPDPPVWLADHLALLYLGGNGVFDIYDVGLSRLITLFRTRRVGGRGH